jgi:hypothetical protein
VFGVFDSVVTNRWYTGGVDTREVLGLGERAVWVCDENGLSKRAICFVVQSTPGYAMKQDADDIVRSYTVAKQR